MILVTGGSGRLGLELKRLYKNALFPTHKELDILKPKKIKCNLVIHCAGYTNVAEAEKDRSYCYQLNVLGTANMVVAYQNVPFVFISSEYAGNPVNYYSKTKKMGEKVVSHHHRHLIIRTLFKSRPYPYDRAWNNQFTMGDYVDVIAKLIKEEIRKWNKKTSKLTYVGTGRKTIYDLAKQTKPDVKSESVDVITWVKLPHDYI